MGSQFKSGVHEDGPKLQNVIILWLGDVSYNLLEVDSSAVLFWFGADTYVRKRLGLK